MTDTASTDHEVGLRAKSVLSRIYHHIITNDEDSKNARALLRTHLLAGDEEHPDRTELAFADIKRVLIECDITAPEDVKPFLVKINISSANPSVHLDDFLDMLQESVKQLTAPPVAPELDFDKMDTTTLVESFVKYYEQVVQYRVEQIEEKLKANSKVLERKLGAKMKEFQHVKEVAREKVGALAEEIEELKSRLHKEQIIEQEVTVERDELRRRLTELTRRPSGPVSLMPQHEQPQPNPAQPTPTPAKPKPAPAPAPEQNSNNKEKYALSELEMLMAELVSPVCPVCKQPVVDDMIKVRGKTYHREHFSCANCARALNVGDNFLELADGRMQCDTCFGMPVDPLCASCHKRIPAGDKVAYDAEKRPFCTACSSKIMEQLETNFICKSCSKEIVGDCINALGAQWHPQCFVCPVCKLDLTSGVQFYDVDGTPYCPDHAH